MDLYRTRGQRESHSYFYTSLSFSLSLAVYFTFQGTGLELCLQWGFPEQKCRASHEPSIGCKGGVRLPGMTLRGPGPLVAKVGGPDYASRQLSRAGWLTDKEHA